MSQRHVPMIAPRNPTVPDFGANRPINDPFPQADEQKIIIKQLPVWNYPPADANSFDWVSYVALPAVGTSAVVLAFTVPQGMNGIIKRLGNVYVGSGFTEGSGGLLWQILANGQPIPGYDAIPASLGATALPSEVDSIRIKENQLIQLVVKNVGLVVGGAQSGGRMSGWYYNKNQEAVEGFV
jgi:hypothetical protein